MQAIGTSHDPTYNAKQEKKTHSHNIMVKQKNMWVFSFFYYMERMTCPQLNSKYFRNKITSI